MSEGAVMEAVKQYLWVFIVLLLLAISIFGIQFGQITNFKQQVNYIIEREGGLTESALNSIEDFSEEYYGGRYSISSDKILQKVKFGEMVNYTITATYKFDYFNIPDITIDYTGTATSKVR